MGNCDVEQVWRTVAGRYSFVRPSMCGELLKEVIVLSYRACLENCCRKVLFCDLKPVWRTVKRRQCGEMLLEGIVL